MERLYTTREAQEFLRIKNIQTIYTMIYKGKLKAQKNGDGDWLIPKSELRRLVMDTKKARGIIQNMMQSQGRMKYIGKEEVEALRIAIRCIDFRDAMKEELAVQYWNDKEVR